MSLNMTPNNWAHAGLSLMENIGHFIVFKYTMSDLIRLLRVLKLEESVEIIQKPFTHFWDEKTQLANWFGESHTTNELYCQGENPGPQPSVFQGSLFLQHPLAFTFPNLTASDLSPPPHPDTPYFIELFVLSRYKSEIFKV